MNVFFQWVLFFLNQAQEAALLDRGDSSRGGRYLPGLCYQQMGELGKADTVLAGLVAKEPKWPPGFYALGRVLFVAGSDGGGAVGGAGGADAATGGQH